jgi:P4 family phage/plasmid primase-like protien
MASEKLLNIVNRIVEITGKPSKSYQGGYLCFCPGHNDKEKASLSVSDPGDKILLNCFVQSGNCSFQELVQIIGLPESEYYHNYEQSKPKKQQKLQSYSKKDNSATEEKDPHTSKRFYDNLDNYAHFQGFDPQILRRAGMEDFTYTVYPENKKVAAIKIVTKNGNRYRLLDPTVDKFRTDKGYKPCWYKLEEAIAIAEKTGQSLIICNGEVSTVIAQSLGLAATCIAMGEGQKVKPYLIEELKNLWQGNLTLALDNDGAGRNGTITRLEVFEKAGFSVVGLQFETEQKSYDLANFCKQWKNLDADKLYKKLIELPPIPDPNLSKNVHKETINSNLNFNVYLEENDLNNFSDIFSSYCTEVNAAYRFVAQHQKDLRYCHPWKAWLFWDGKKWVDDNIGKVFRCGVLTSLSILEQAERMSRETKEEIAEYKLMFDHAMAFQNKGKLNNMMEIAKHAPGIFVLPDQFDQNPWTLNCQNGIVNLLTGELRPHDNKEYITKITIADYNKEATCPNWLSFLDKIMGGNQNLVGYLQRAIGYSLTGNTMEKALFFLYGALGDNGKSTFLETISTILGTYALAKFPMAALLDDAHNSTSANPSPYIAQLCGVRFVSGSELSGNKKLNEETIKDLTGGIDSISAKRLYQNPFTFKPTHKLFMFGNEKPIIPRSAKAVWNRLKTIPFMVSIPKKEQDLDLPFKLIEEKAGILAWAIQGCIDWQKERLGMPEEIQAANDAYKEEMDLVNFFLLEECNIGDGLNVKAQHLYDHYREWCKKNGHNPYNQLNFGKELKAHDYENYKGTKGYSFWKRIELKAEREIEDFNIAVQNLVKNKQTQKTL